MGGMPRLITIALLQQHETDALTRLVWNRTDAPEGYGSSKGRYADDCPRAWSTHRINKEKDARIEVRSKEDCSMSRPQKITLADTRDMGGAAC